MSVEIGNAQSRPWGERSSAVRDIIVIATAAAFAWLVIERTETCDRFFDWVAENPGYEVDSFILAFILASIGVAAFAWRRYIEMGQSNEARDAAQQEAHTLAFHDPLTGLPNRRAFNERLAAKTSAKKPIGLVMVDLDRFKAVNDLHGHAAGDRLLRIVSQRLQSEMGPGQAVYRLGGDEFAIVTKLTDPSGEEAQRVARHLVKLLSEPVADGNLVHHIGASAGIALFPEDANSADALVRAADVALYRAKGDGRGQHRSFEAAMDLKIKRRAALELDMRNSIAKREFHPAYQPLIDLESGRTIGFEMLARWQRSGEEPIGPDEFIGIAEESGLINELVLDLLDQTCMEARSWDPELTIAVNISPVQLKDPWLSEKVMGVLARHGFAPQRLAIEITENAIIADEENARRTIQSFKNQGMRIGLDDFGTGYSSLHHLRVLPFDKIKIDRSFVMALATDPEAEKIIRAITGLAKSLGLPVIAEGIESAEIAVMLKDMGCQQGQGFHFGRPISGTETKTMLDAEQLQRAECTKPFADPLPEQLRLSA
jgi:diguanylate cyclase (GGDEF)-like protein